ncbi:2-hydroxyacyl-CoA dehydratase [Candidatus Poribacteria bacterium]|nr:2-hydroxyacyl-CoA dehydratase [Candidatus Poribacteria bacterium]
MNSQDPDASISISYFCSCVPQEIIMAAGLAPKRMIPRARPSEADAYIHPNTCPYVKSLLASALASRESKTAGVVFANSCDGMRRLHDIWREYAKTVPSLFIEVPKKSDPDSIEFFGSELRRLADNVETEFSGSRVTVAGLNDAIRECNHIRRLMAEVFRLQRDADSGVSGLSVFNLCLEGAESGGPSLMERLQKFVSEPREREPGGDKPRILLTGNVVHRPDLITLVEDLGGRLVALDTCIGARHYETLVEENSADPLTALARRYLQKPSCARMEGIEQRFQYLKRMASDSAADGVIFSAVKFCEHYAYEASLMRTTFEEAGIPFLYLENDYEWSGVEQARTRVEAFLTIVGGRRSE